MTMSWPAGGRPPLRATSWPSSVQNSSIGGELRKTNRTGAAEVLLGRWTVPRGTTAAWPAATVIVAAPMASVSSPSRT